MNSNKLVTKIAKTTRFCYDDASSGSLTFHPTFYNNDIGPVLENGHNSEKFLYLCVPTDSLQVPACFPALTDQMACLPDNKMMFRNNSSPKTYAIIFCLDIKLIGDRVKIVEEKQQPKLNSSSIPCQTTLK